MLSDMLHNEGIFHGIGLPANEYFHFTRMDKLLKTIKETSMADFFRRLIEDQSVVYKDVKVCGVKMLLDHLIEVMDLDRPTQSVRLFPGSLKFIFLRRYNKLRQAISCMRAEREGLWHRRSLKSFLRYFFLSYDPEDIESYMRKIERKEEWILSFFQRHHIYPLILYYENLCSSSEAVLQRVFDFLGIEKAHKIRAKTKYKKVSGLKTSLIARSYRKYSAKKS